FINNLFSLEKQTRKQNFFSALKKSGSGIVFLRESKATAALFFCAKAKRQRQLRHGKINCGRI
ncbi:hypothetical protein ACIQ69_28120, partial [Bacillus paramycoides]|uniref:hypothetical protein n=1 Tax=Bacillus paramycoides TaxID=2026194 RepID=UPI00382C1DA1